MICFSSISYSFQGNCCASASFLVGSENKGCGILVGLIICREEAILRLSVRPSPAYKIKTIKS